MSGRTSETRRPPAKPLIGVTVGDPSGIGPEVVVKALADPVIRRQGRFVIYGVESALRRAANAADVSPFWFPVTRDEISRVDSGVVLVHFEEHDRRPDGPARATEEGGLASLRFVDSAIEGARTGPLNAIVTGPIHKVAWKLAGCRFAGHTEKLAHAFKEKRVTMMFAAGDLRVALASTHVALMEIRNLFTIGHVFQPIDLMHEALSRWFGVDRPRIGVAGLNPHAGEQGRFGDEEKRIIEPAILMARSGGIDVEGPFSADTLFTPNVRGRYDGLVAMYHDQGLIPVKLLAFDSAINVTLGLPIIRTSVDHGTAFDIADTNQANPGSMKAALRWACTLAVNTRAQTQLRERAPVPIA